MEGGGGCRERALDHSTKRSETGLIEGNRPDGERRGVNWFRHGLQYRRTALELMLGSCLQAITPR